VSAHGFLPQSASADDVFILAGQAFAAGMFGLLMAAIIAIVMSSQESVLNSGAVAFVRDIVAVMSPRSERTMLLLARFPDCPIRRHCDLCQQNLRSIIDGLLIVYSILGAHDSCPDCSRSFPAAANVPGRWLSMLSGGGLSLVWQLVCMNPWSSRRSRRLVAALLGLCCRHAVGRTRGQLQGNLTWRLSCFMIALTYAMAFVFPRYRHSIRFGYSQNACSVHFRRRVRVRREKSQ